VQEERKGWECGKQARKKCEWYGERDECKVRDVEWCLVNKVEGEGGMRLNGCKGEEEEEEEERSGERKRKVTAGKKRRWGGV
jgi:hypothetical protein